MTIAEIREKIMTDDEFVLSELETLVSYYQLKHTIRWSHKRNQDETESVAEHVYGMHILADYFLPLLKSEEVELDLELVQKMITWHDMAEALVGDMTTRSKTKDHMQKELEAEREIVKTGPTHLRTRFDEIFEAYNEQKSLEAKFVKAIDKIEPQVHLFFLLQKNKDLAEYFYLGWSAEEYREHRRPYVETFPIIQRFDDILYQHISASQFHR